MEQNQYPPNQGLPPSQPVYPGQAPPQAAPPQAAPPQAAPPQAAPPQAAYPGQATQPSGPPSYQPAADAPRHYQTYHPAQSLPPEMLTFHLPDQGAELLLECRNVGKNFGGKQVLHNVNLLLGRNKIVGLLGPNGAGKTTLIKIINGLIPPSCGEIKIAGEPPGVRSHSLISYLPDQNYLNDWMRIEDIFHFFADFYSDFDLAKAHAMLADLHVDARSRMKTLSKGMKEKVQLVLVMSRNAQLYLLDEPIGGVDPAAREYIINTIISNYQENATVLISTHLISEIERVLDEVIFINYGTIVLNAHVDEVREKGHRSIDSLFREVFRC